MGILKLVEVQLERQFECAAVPTAHQRRIALVADADIGPSCTVELDRGGDPDRVFGREFTTAHVAWRTLAAGGRLRHLGLCFTISRRLGIVRLVFPFSRRLGHVCRRPPAHPWPAHAATCALFAIQFRHIGLHGRPVFGADRDGHLIYLIDWKDHGIIRVYVVAVRFFAPAGGAFNLILCIFRISCVGCNFVREYARGGDFFGCGDRFFACRLRRRCGSRGRCSHRSGCTVFNEGEQAADQKQAGRHHHG